MWQAIGTVIQIIWFLLKKKFESDEDKKKKKEEITNEIKKAFSEPDRKVRASRLNSVVGDIRRMR